MRERNAKNVPLSESWADEDLEKLRLGVQRYAESLDVDEGLQEKKDILSKLAWRK